MSADPAVQDAAPASLEGAVAQANENERGGDATVSAPRRRAPSPISTRQDPNRPFAFKRQSSGFTSFMNSIASPTSEVRTRPATPAESATRSTFFTGSPAIPDPLPTSAAPVFSVSPLPAQQDLELPAAPALQLRGPSPLPDEDEDRPKGQGTLELERVLGMWAAKTASSSSFPSLPPLPSASSSTAANSGSAAPLFAQAVVTAEPESLDLASSAGQPQASTASASSSLSSVFADFAQLAALQPTASASRDLLDLPRPPRRQRSKSEADIISMDFSNLGAVTFAQASQDGGSTPDFNRAFHPSSSQPPSLVNAPSYPSSTAAADVFRPPSAPSGYGHATTAGSTADALQLHSYDLAGRSRPSATHQRGGGGPGYREAALLDVGGGTDRGRRAKSQGVGHRRSAKSDDFTPLFSQPVGGGASFAQQQQHAQTTYATSNGHLAPPGGAPPAVVAPPQRVLPPFSTGSAPAQGGPGTSPHLQHQVYYVPNGQSVPIQVAYLTSIDPATGQSMLTPVPQPQQPQQQQQHHHHHQQQQALYPPRHPHPQYSPQGNALALAAAQAAQAHAASVAQAAMSASSSSSMPYQNGAADGQRRPSAGRLSVASTAGSSHSPGGISPGGHNAYGAPRAPFSYRSPVSLGLPGLPSPSAPANGLSPGGASSGRSGAGGARKRSRASAVAAAAALKREEDDEGDEDEDDAAGDEDAEMRDDAYDDDEADYDDDGRAEPSLRAPAVFGKGRKKASGSGGGKKGAKPGLRTAGGFDDDDDDEFTKESKTTQATIDAAKRRRNAGAVAKFVCELCGETFTRRYNLRGHQRAHKGEKPYRCSQEDCDKSFARAHDCKRHELLHLGVRKYNCAPCKRDFVRLDALHRHHRSEVGQECVKKLQADGAKFDDKGAQIL
ncbi:hypothetical protein JCM9279_000985 [Rhodotorula babjevae]